MIRDRNIEWKSKRLFLPSPGIGWDATGLVGRHTGAPTTGELGALGFGAITFNALGDEYVQMIPLPRDLDVEHPVYFRVYWTTDGATAADTSQFILTYADIAAGEEFTAADTALNTAIATDTYGTATALILAITEWGKVNASTFTEGDMLVLETELNATDVDVASTELVFFLGLEMEYTPKATSGVGPTQEGYRS